MDTNFYVYAHLRKDNNVVFYVGKGRNYRATDSRPTSRNSEWDKINKEAKGFNVFYLAKNLTEEQALNIEKFYLNNTPNTWKLTNKKKTNNILPILYSEVNKYYYYDESSSTFLRHRFMKSGRGLKDAEAGSRSGKYFNALINHKSYRLHRLIYSLVHKIDIPTNLQINHIDCNSLNNKITNLELVTATKNNSNKNIHKTCGTIIEGNKVLGINYREFKYSKDKITKYIIVTVCQNAKKKSKSFNLDIYTLDEALELAKQWKLANSNL